MQRIALPPLERRLQKRYRLLVQGHMRAAHPFATGVCGVPHAASAFAATQAGYRFLSNPRIDLPALVEPLRAVGRERGNASASAFVLLVHDWCKLAFPRGGRKRDVTTLTHETNVGYELTTALLVRGEDGSPLAPMEMHLRTEQGLLSTRPGSSRPVHHLEQLLPTMRASRSWGLNKPLLHVIDREADSVDHYRQWDADGHWFLVRADERRVRSNGTPCLLSETARKLRQARQFRCAGEALYHGRSAPLWIAETAVVLDQVARKNVGGRKYQKPGRALPLRFVVVQIRDPRNRRLAEWFLLSNAPAEQVSTAALAQSYYWRWRIESYFKLLKSHGQHVEQWQQHTGMAMSRRLLVAAMACVVVWQLQADPSPAAREFKNVLVRLSGRQTSRRNPHTAPALLAGLWVLLAVQSLPQLTSPRRLQRLANQYHFLDTG